MKRLVAAMLLCFGLAGAQQSDFSVLSIPDALKQNANSVIRQNKLKVEVSSRRSMK